ncbi:hypothetical protein ABIA42_002366 [Bradyrhizobium sp. USDA 327]
MRRISSPPGLDLLGVLVVDLHDVVTAGHLEQFVELSMDRLGVAVLGALDHQRHAPCRQGRERVPFESVAQRDPGDAVDQEDGKRGRARGGDADLGKPAF